MAEALVSFHALTSGIVLDRSVFVTLNSDLISKTIQTIRESEKRVVVVDNAKTFFTSAQMLALIKSGDDGYKLIAEKIGVKVSEEDVSAIRRVEAIVEALKPPLPPYKFAKVPEGWSIETDLSMNKVSVARKRTNPNGDGTGWRITFNQLKRIWTVASKVWESRAEDHFNFPPSISVYDIAAGGYNRNGTVYSNRVSIGCQTIRRYELEQLALHMAWDFPGPKG